MDQTATSYPHLFSEGKIGNLILKNRIIMPALESGMANFDGTPSEKLIRYYEERAKSGLGMQITGITRVNDSHAASAPRQLSLARDRHIKPFAEMVKRVQSHGTKIICQLHHPGRQNYSMMQFWPVLQAIGRIWPGFWTRVFPKISGPAEWFTTNVWGPAVPAPSKVPCGLVKQKVRALRRSEIHKLVRDFIKAAERAQMAGADGVEIHASHGYLIQQFLSTRTNLRLDEYGGSLHNRMRFLTEIVEGVRKSCGPGFPILVRLTVDEFYENEDPEGRGITLDEGVQMAQKLESLGIDALNISSATYETLRFWLEPTTFQPGWRSHLSEEVRKKVSLPIIAASMIRTPEQAEKLLAQGNQDFVALGRAQVVDPRWVEKVREGREEEIHRCIACCFCFTSLNENGRKGLPFECALNPIVSDVDADENLVEDGAGRKIIVIGAGPAGLEAAEILGRRKFDVTLYEKNQRPGGQLRLAGAPPNKEKIIWAFDDMEAAALRAGVKIEYNSEISPEFIKQENPYAVFLATGGRAAHPPISGADQPHVCTITEILSGKVSLKDKTVAVIGSGMTGLETAEFLAEQGNRIIIVEMMKEIGPGADPLNLSDVSARLDHFNPEYLTGYKLIKIESDSIHLEKSTDRQSKKSGDTSLIRKADQVVLAVGVRSVNELEDPLKKVCHRVITIGDANKFGRIADAVRGGYQAASTLR